MATAIQAVPDVSPISSLSPVKPIPPLVQRAVPLRFVPSVVLTLGTTSPAPLAYNSAGLLAPIAPSAPDSNRSSSTVKGMLTTNQALARQIFIDLYSCSTELDAAAAARYCRATNLLLGLSPDSIAQGINKLLANVGLGTASPATVSSKGATPAFKGH